MALYVSIVLLAAMIAISDDTLVHDDELFYLIWGTTLGLAIAHWVAFSMASRLVHGRPDREDVMLAVSQLSGPTAVAIVCTVPVVLLPGDVQADVVRLLLGFVLGLTGYLTARHMGAGTARSIGAGAVALACTAREQGENAARVHARGGHGVEADLDRRAVVEVDVARVPLRGERAHLAPLDLVLVASEPETDLEIL